MANCHDLFLEFSEKILLTDTAEKLLRVGRDALRARITSHFKDTLEETPPTFAGQGSFKLRTTVRPVEEDGEYDIDDGVYLQNLDVNPTKWPAEATVHGWIVDAVAEHTDTPPIDKSTCVRVVYKTDKYHIDLPIYGLSGSTCYLFDKSGRRPSDPRAFTDWFLEQVDAKGEQLRQVTKYLKAWSDKREKYGKMPCGFVLSCIVPSVFAPSDRDDVALGQTARGMADLLASKSRLANPKDNTEDLRVGREDQFDRLLLASGELAKVASDALHESSKKKACRMWRKELGDRFPSCETVEEEDDVKVTSKPAGLARDDGRFA